jgi:8-oxo-dGTP pyrophosphatase MutT (NUDIX family)
MITKLATFRGVTQRGDPLVRVFRQGESVTKVAGNLMGPIQDWLGAYKSDSSKIAILVNALGASEFWGQNVNGDIFPEGALIHDCRCHPGERHATDEFTGKVIPPYGYWTFLNAFPYVHHRNKDPTRAFGKVSVACWNPKMKRVELVVLIDRHLAMQHDAQHIVDRIDRGDYPDVSMGCRVPYDICTICGNKSKTRNDYCSCVKNIGMGKILDDGRRIGVINTYPRFFDISFVFIGADKTAKMMCKLGSVWVPQSVADAERAYSFQEDVDGIIKAACGREGGCAECRGTCKLAEPRIAGVSLAESDRILSKPKSDGWLSNAKRLVPSLVRRRPLRTATHVAAMAGERSLEKGSSSQSHLSAETYSSGTDEPTRHKRLTHESRDGESKTFLERLAPPPPVSRTLYGKEDPQDDGTSARILNTNEDTPTDGVEDDAKLSAAQFKMGPPPSPNRDEFPFIGTINFRGLLIYVENAPGTWRTGPGWKTLMKVPYGEFARSLGTDGDKLDVYVGPDRNCENVFIIHQNFAYGPKKGEYDEDKVMLGFNTAAQAKKMYLAHYDSPKFFRSITTMSFPLFKKALLRREVDGEKVAGSLALRPKVDVFIYDDLGRVLAERHGNSWKFPGGGIDPGENATSAARREALEEVGLEVGKPFQIRRPDTVVWSDAEKEIYSKKGRTQDGNRLYYRAAPAADKNKNLLGVDEDAMKARFVPIDRVIGDLERSKNDPANLFREYDANKVEALKNLKGKVKTAESLRLEDLFDSATTENSVRRERTWRDKTSGKETNVKGSGMGSWEKTKTAGYLEKEIAYAQRHGDIPDAKTRWKWRTPAERKVYAAKAQKFNVASRKTTEAARARLRAAGKPIPTINDLFKKSSVRVYSPMDLYKLAVEDKEAAKRKWAEIIKQVGPSKAVGQTSPLLSASEPDIPAEALDAMGSKGLESALATPSLMGMVLKPREFQRLTLAVMGRKDLADKLDDADAIFKPQMGEAPPCSCLEPQHMDMDLLKRLLPLLSQRSYFGPVVKRRIICITVSKPPEPRMEQEVDSPLLSKIGAAYNWYRREQMKLAADSYDTVARVPELHSGIYGVDTEDLFKSAMPAPDGATKALMLGSVPLTLMYSAHLSSEKEKGRNLGMLGRFVADHPWLSTLGVAAGVKALMMSPETRKHIDEGGARASKVLKALGGQ